MKHHTFRSSVIMLNCLIIIMLLATGCSPYSKTSGGKNIQLVSVTGTTPISLAPGFWGNPSNGVLTITVKNVTSETLDIDVWADVVAGLFFIGENGNQNLQTALSGIPMRPDETRVIEFYFVVDPKAIVGEYIINIHITVPAKEDQINVSFKIAVQK